MLLSAEHISINFGSRQLLDDVNFYLNEGDKTGIIGINGTGKSTFLKVLAGVIEPLLAAIPGSIEQIACVGSVMIIAIGLNLIGITKIKVADFLPAIIYAPIIYNIANLILNLV